MLEAKIIAGKSAAGWVKTAELWRGSEY